MIQEIDKTFYERTGIRLLNTSMLNSFKVLKEVQTGTNFLNLFTAYKLNKGLNDRFVFDTYEVDQSVWWDDISKIHYGTPYLWWVIALTNGVLNPFEELEHGKNIKILKPSLLYQLLKELKAN